MKLLNIQKNNLRGRGSNGFTLIETLVAVAILLLGITAAFSAFHLGISSTSDTRDRITAIFLAQEAVEAVKNAKDSNLLDISQGQGNPNWLKNILTNGNQGNGGPCDNTPCAYDIFDNDGNGAFHNCSNAADGCVVKLYDEDGDGIGDFYRQGNESWLSETNFVREIYVDEINRDMEARVQVVITKTDDPDFRFETSTLIYNWF